MKKIVKLTERDLTRIVRRVLNEQQTTDAILSSDLGFTVLNPSSQESEYIDKLKNKYFRNSQEVKLYGTGQNIKIVSDGNTGYVFLHMPNCGIPMTDRGKVYLMNSLKKIIDTLKRC